RCLGLQTAALATGTQLVIRVQRQMAEFPGKPVVPAEIFAVEYHAQAYTPPQVDYHCILPIAGGAEPELGQRDQSRVVLEKGFNARPLGDELCQRPLRGLQK